ncbi:hypothetical protein FF36_02524 [Frankia torreyi]|uniref:Uncharacterized protein n=1 Tax=Frankia torreyi TaxID=1856 RepID=A0A0D8BG13_9ACTN|nr:MULTISPECIES: hypothetical protein [Frankia]KJE23096.1 hypothetical protein FF36_02524 [Frankia torreyi]KQC36851.1 hypothetical protein UK82_18920 [Frankia sp. ACN1ag]KQM06618.1 hypothetical protein FF86_100727 [Frankia sp. CpI1-P]
MPDALDTAGILAATHAIRPRLSALVGPAHAAQLDTQLADALTHPDPTQAAAELDRLLRNRPQTRAFLRRVLADAPHYRPPTLDQETQRAADSSRGVALAGDSGVVDADRFICPDPDCDYAWHRPSVGDTVRHCPDHAVALIPG